jgi:hypothetical protein
MVAKTGGAVVVKFTQLLCALISLAAVSPVAWSDNDLLGEVELVSATRVERDAGVWVDGQYVGHVKELDGHKGLLLVPGEHRLLLKLVGYRDVESDVVVAPGQKRTFSVAMAAETDAVYPSKDQTGKVRLSVEPARAAVFVNGAYAGHVDRFDGHRGMRLAAGTYEFRITLPGYRPFETTMTVLTDQEYEIKTDLQEGSMADQSDDLVVHETPRF